jgi:hypothetical protein
MTSPDDLDHESGAHFIGKLLGEDPRKLDVATDAQVEAMMDAAGVEAGEPEPRDELLARIERRRAERGKAAASPAFGPEEVSGTRARRVNGSSSLGEDEASREEEAPPSARRDAIASAAGVAASSAGDSPSATSDGGAPANGASGPAGAPPASAGNAPPSGAKDDPPSSARTRRSRTALIAGGVLAAAAAAVVAVGIQQARRGPEAISPEPSSQPDSPAKRAGRLRDEAFQACQARDWDTCGAKLDSARDLDPAGESDPRVVAARTLLANPTAPPPPPPPQPKPTIIPMRPK